MHGCKNMKYLSVYNSDGKVTLWPGPIYFDLLLYRSTAGKPENGDVRRHKRTLVQTAQSSSCNFSPSHYWVRGGQAERKRESYIQIQWHSILSAPGTDPILSPTTTPVLSKDGYFCRYLYIHTAIDPPPRHTGIGTETCLDWARLIVCDIWALEIIHVLRVATDSSLFQSKQFFSSCS